MSYLGDIAVGAILDFKFTTRRFSTGAPFALASGAIRVYKDNSDVEDDSGITLSADFDSKTGLNHVRIDTSADGTFYSAGSNFQVVISAGTVDTVSVAGEVVADFSIAHRPIQSIGASVITATSIATDAIGAAELADGAITAGTFAAGAIDATAIANGAIDAATFAAGAIDATAIANGAIDAATFAAGAIDAAAISADAGAEIADAVLNRDMSTGTDSGSTTVRTPRQALRFLRNKWDIAGGTLTVTKEDDTTASWTAAVTSTAGDPISGSDPAGP